MAKYKKAEEPVNYRSTVGQVNPTQHNNSNALDALEVQDEQRMDS